MSFHTKLFLIFATVVVLIFSVINFVSLYFFIEEQQNHREEMLSLYQKILQQNKDYPLPPYIKRYNNELTIDKTYFEERFKSYTKTVLLWESLLVVSLMYLFYRTVKVLSKKEMEYEEFLKVLLFLISHKIGNFLSVMKTNLEILRVNPEKKVIDRLQNSCNILNEDITKTIETVKRIPTFTKKQQRINLKETLNKTLSKFAVQKNIKLNVSDVFLYTNEDAVETMLFLILDNAFRYSNSRVHIKLCKNALAVKNDFAQLTKSSGVGLQIIDYLAKKSGYTLKYRAKDEHFIVLLKFKNN